MPVVPVSEAVCRDRHDTLNRVASAAGESASAAHRRLDGLVGIDGGKGRVGTLESDMDKVAVILEKIAQQQQQGAVKLAVLWALASLVGGGVSVAIITIVKVAL